MKSRRRGFTLLEVLATMVLMAIILPVTMHGISVGLAAAGSARKSVEAVTLAQNKLTELSTATQLTTSSQSGDFGADFPDFHWDSSTISRELSMVEIDVKVTWTSRGGERNVSLSTLVYKPS